MDLRYYYKLLTKAICYGALIWHVKNLTERSFESSERTEVGNQAAKTRSSYHHRCLLTEDCVENAREVFECQLHSPGLSLHDCIIEQSNRKGIPFNLLLEQAMKVDAGWSHEKFFRVYASSREHRDPTNSRLLWFIH